MLNEENFVDDLSCEELCVISQKKEYGGKLSDKRMSRLAKGELNSKMCEC